MVSNHLLLKTIAALPTGALCQGGHVNGTSRVLRFRCITYRRMVALRGRLQPTFQRCGPPASSELITDTCEHAMVRARGGSRVLIHQDCHAESGIVSSDKEDISDDGHRRVLGQSHQ